MIKTVPTVGLAVDWLEDNSSVTAQTAEITTTDAVVVGGNTWDYSACYTYPIYWQQSVPTKVRLRMSEVERLRAASKKDKALRAVLEKFGPHIEVEVDFG